MRSDHLTRLRQALGELEAYSNEPIVTNRDRAGIIQAFEFTFELFWRAFQHEGQTSGAPPRGPKAALKSAFELGLITDEALWLTMLDDRNLTSHTYNRELAADICRAVVERYLPAFQATVKVLAEEQR